jgi:hypothetical protein
MKKLALLVFSILILAVSCTQKKEETMNGAQEKVGVKSSEKKDEMGEGGFY